MTADGTADGTRPPPPPPAVPDWMVAVVGSALVVGCVRYLVAVGALALVTR